jgi:secreted Zn-dependent insulinase-like peptidase
MFKIKKVIRLPLLSILLLLSIGSYAQSEIITSSRDSKIYESFILDNGLSVLVISDPNADVAAASLTVSVGSKHSPTHRLGLAHLLEHIVLLGSEKYSDIGSFNQFFKQQNGWSNGSTRPDNTRYHFQLNDSAFDEGLSRLADTLHAPLFTDKIIETATTAVESEYQGKIKNEWRGTLQVIRTQLNPEHPASKFSVGSLTTLKPKGSDFKSDILGFYSNYYVAQNMKLVLYAKQSIEQLKKRAIKHFSHISSQGKLVKVSKEPLRLKSQLATQTNIKISNETSSIDILFEVPAPIADLNNKTSHYIESLLTQRTQGSLFSFLKAQGLITDISISHLGDRAYGLLDVYFVLTEKGLVEQEQVISSLFSYIKMLKTAEHSNNIYQELSVLAKREFDYAQPDEPGDWIDRINSDMLIYPLKNVLNHSANYTGLNKPQLTAYLKQFSPNNMQVFLNSSKVTTDKIEPLYNMAYSVRPFDEKQLKNWQNPQINPYFSLPQSNPFIGLNELKTYDV